MHVPILALLLVPLFAVSAAFAIELPNAPPDYSWHQVPAIKGAFLVPSGWHVREESSGSTLAIFITAKPFEPPQQFETGLSVNVFRDTPSAPAQLKQMLYRTCSAHEKRLQLTATPPFALMTCEFEPTQRLYREASRFVSSTSVLRTLTRKPATSLRSKAQSQPGRKRGVLASLSSML